MGVGSIRRMSAVHWGVVGNIIWGWVLTIPLAALMSAGAYVIGSHFLK
jgi:PiT family inorganic phosphate transporter